MLNDEIIKLIDDVEIVSFDIFDTLLERNVTSPYNVFELTQMLYERNYGNLGIDFKNIRIKSEKILRKATITEITINEIYKEIEKRTHINKLEIDILKNIEIDLEKNILKPNKEIIDVYDYCVIKNKTIIITSDMYLTKDIISEILMKNNIKYNKLYLSSDIKKTKAKGDIYDYILSDLKISSKKILHIGDNEKADYLNAKDKKINAIYYRKEINNHIYKNKEIFDYFNNGIIKNLIYNNEDFWYKFGVENVGIIYLTFIEWLINEINKNKIEKVFFLARDGKVLKEAYDIITSDMDLPVSEYILASRRGLNIPALYILDDAEINLLLMYVNGKKIDSIFKKIGLEINKYRDVITKFNLNVDEIQINRDEKNLRLLLEYLRNEILDNSKLERELYIKYLNEKGIQNHKVAVIDIGWNGTLQYSLQKMVENENLNTEIYGYYYGLNNKSLKNIGNGNRMKGFLYQINKGVENYNIISSFNSFFEELFIADHGSFIKFDKDMKVIYEDFEYNYNEYKKLRKIQEGALDYITYITPLIKKYNLNLDDPNIALKKIKRVFLRPEISEVDKLGRIIHFDYESKYNCNPEGNIFEYIKNPKMLITEYKKSTWKIGFVKKVFKTDIAVVLFIVLKKLIKKRGKNNVL